MPDLHLDLDVTPLVPMRFGQIARLDVDASLPPSSVTPQYHDDLIEARTVAMELQVWGRLDANLP